MNDFITSLKKYWDVENTPKYDLRAERSNEMPLKVANWFYIGVTLAVFGTVAFLMVMGVLASL